MRSPMAVIATGMLNARIIRMMHTQKSIRQNLFNAASRQLHGVGAADESRSGGQTIFGRRWSVGPIGTDGYPRPIFDKLRLRPGRNSRAGASDPPPLLAAMQHRAVDSQVLIARCVESPQVSATRAFLFAGRLSEPSDSRLGRALMAHVRTMREILCRDET